MNDRIQTVPAYGYGTTLSQEQRNKVLRNTCLLYTSPSPRDS